MSRKHGRSRSVGLLVAGALCLGACASHQHAAADDDAEINTYPTNYKADILGAMRVYLSDPRGIRDAAVAPPTLTSIEKRTRYIACVRFNSKQRNAYAGMREFAAVFLAAHFDHFVEKAHEQCGNAAYAPFPELEKLPP